MKQVDIDRLTLLKTYGTLSQEQAVEYHKLLCEEEIYLKSIADDAMIARDKKAKEAKYEEDKKVKDEEEHKVYGYDKYPEQPKVIKSK